MERKNEQRSLSNQSNPLPSCQCDAVEHPVCCCSHKGGSGCPNAYCCSNNEPSDS